MSLFTLTDALAWLPDAELVGDGSVAVDRVNTDTRTLTSGDLFIALRGEKFDANDFLADAKAKGASAAIAERSLAENALAGFLVQDSRVALAQLATGWRKKFDLPLIAVTGSNGKTTVTQMIASILRAWKGDAALSTQGNLNNDIGVPLTVLRLRDAHEVAVVELGMNHPGEIAGLASIARPTVALVNNAQREHLEFMSTVEAVARENGSVISSLGKDGVAVFPAGEEFTDVWKSLARDRTCMTFSSDAGTDANVSLASAEWGTGGWQVAASTPAGNISYELHIAGRHNVLNSLAAVACALAAGVPEDAIARGLSSFEPVKGRSRAMSIEAGSRAITLVDDTYNANPDSMRAAVDVLAELPSPRLLVLGDMGEVGDEGPQFHAEVGAHARSSGIEHIFVFGDLMKHAVDSSNPANNKDRSTWHFADIDTLTDAVIAQLQASPEVSSVLVKGSRFMKMERVVEAIKQKIGDAQCC